MSSEGRDRFHRLETLFEAVVDLPANAREAAIQDLCGDDPVLQRELRALLDADGSGRAEGLLAAVVQEGARGLTSDDPRGRLLGAWRVLGTLGEGGMGTVYLAERADGAYEARAAVKLVRGGMPSASLSRRFRAERQILAGLSHPGIARLLDGGSTEDGTPYLVMEYVDGAPITDWCDARRLGVEERLELFLSVCDAVAYAHRALVAHRDLKPSNILVGADGVPKLLDFGIAKLMDEMADSDERATVTRMVLTPAYASPEQVLGKGAGVTADVYSLGVVLYELLAGRLPIATRGLTPAELAARVTGEIPPLMSAQVPARARRRLAGDLDAIVSRALRKEPEGRYASVEAMAEDVRLHLEGRPIKVRRDDWVYRARKLVRRNRGVVSGSLLVLLLGISFVVNAVLQARAVAAERDRAEAEREAAQRVSAFLEELFSEADPNQATARDITVREILDRGAARVSSGLRDQPEVQSTLAMVMGRVYRALGVYEASEPLLDSALAVRRAGSGFDARDLADALVERGALAYDLGDYEESVALHTEALAAYRRDLGDVDEARIAGALEWIGAAMAELGDLEGAEPFAREAVAMYRRLDPGPNPDLTSALSGFTDLLRTSGQYEEAFQMGGEALAMARAVYGDDHLEVAAALNQHASTLSRWGRPEEAVPLVEEALAIQRATFDGPHVETAAGLGNLANILGGLGRMEEALAARRASTEMLQEIFGSGHPYLAAGTHSLGALLLAMGRVAEAEPVLREALAAHRVAFPPDHPNLGAPLTELGRLYRESGRVEDALGALQEAYRVRRGGLPEGHWHVALSGFQLGLTLDDAGRPEEAEPYLVEAHETLLATFGPEDDRVVRAGEALGEHLARRGLEETTVQDGPGG